MNSLSYSLKKPFNSRFKTNLVQNNTLKDYSISPDSFERSKGNLGKYIKDYKSQPNSKKQSEVSTSQSAQQEVFKQEYINSYLKTNNPKFFFKNEPPKFNFGTNAKCSKKGESYLSNDFSKKNEESTSLSILNSKDSKTFRNRYYISKTNLNTQLIKNKGLRSKTSSGTTSPKETK